MAMAVRMQADRHGRLVVCSGSTQSGGVGVVRDRCLRCCRCCTALSLLLRRLSLSLSLHFLPLRTRLLRLSSLPSCSHLCVTRGE